MSTGAPEPYPLRVEGSLEPSLSRWLWVVKWLLAIPHYIVLVFLWAAFVVMTVVAFFAILFTRRYPRGIFDFNVGVLRWTWRVAFYSYGALGTDRYPPFTLDEVDDYPAKLHVDYPEELSRGLVLVKWWLLAIPQYVIVAILLGGGWWLWWSEGAWGPGLIAVLVIIAGLALLFTTRYPKGLFDFVLGLDRWAFRVAAYAGLMTDRYPPFRLDQGAVDLEPAPRLFEPPVAEEAVATEAAPARRKWTAGRIAAIVAGSILALIALGLLAGGVTGIVYDLTQRDSDGFLMSPEETFDTASYALVSETLDIGSDVPEWVVDDLIGTVRIKSESDRPVFVGIASERDVESYLGNVRRAVVTHVSDPSYSPRPGGPPPSPPGRQTFWVASTSGAGSQVLDWDVDDGDWVIVVMNPNGSAGVTADLRIGAELDLLIWIAIGFVVVGLLIGGGAAALIYVGVRRPRSAQSDRA